MASHHRMFKLFVLLIVTSLFLAGCEIPAPRADTTDPGVEITTTDPDTGGGIITPTPPSQIETSTDNTDTTDTTDNTGYPAEGDTGDGTTTDEGDTADTGDTTGDGSDTTDDAGTEDPNAGGGTPSDAGDTSDTSNDSSDTTDDNSDDTADDATDSTTTPATHTVKAGENLYRIGLQYGISWQQIAQYNNIAAPYRISVGQVLNLPGSSPDPDPEPPTSETVHVVQAGENLYRIGLRYGVSWTQIAEANGIVNPNVLTVGQQLKIPTSTPGPTPTFTHVVKQGETLYSISIQYGVSWTAIASENQISAPYVIFVGQTLSIPGR